MSALGFSEEVKENTAIQGHLAGLFVGALENERIRHDVIREALTMLSVAIGMAKDSEKVWKTTRIDGVLIGN